MQLFSMLCCMPKDPFQETASKIGKHCNLVFLVQQEDATGDIFHQPLHSLREALPSHG